MTHICVLSKANRIEWHFFCTQIPGKVNFLTLVLSVKTYIKKLRQKRFQNMVPFNYIIKEKQHKK